MNCKDFYKNVNQFIENNLPAEQVKEMQDHMESCPKCKRYCFEITKIKSVLSSLEKKAPKADFESMIIQKIKNKDFTPGLWETFLHTAKTSLMAALLLLGIISAFSFLTPSVAVESDNIEALNNYVLKNIPCQTDVDKFLIG